MKKLLNRIYRKQRKLEVEAEKGDIEAMHILHFQYRGSKQLYELDDNTITIDDLMPKLRSLEHRMQEAGMDTSTASIDIRLLDKY